MCNALALNPPQGLCEAVFTRVLAVDVESGESFGLSVFLRDSDTIYRSPFTRGRDRDLGRRK